MILSVADYKALYPSDNTADSVLEMKLKALESAVRAYTNNNFQSRNKRIECAVVTGKLGTVSPFFTVGDTVMISKSQYNDGVYDVSSVEANTTTLSEVLYDEAYALVTKVEYPYSVRLGVAGLLWWNCEMKDKVGIASETISRHTVSYFDMGNGNALMGYPAGLISFLKPYMKARF